MKIIVDTNIVFSAIINSKSNIGDLLLNSFDHLEFISVSFLQTEIENHKKKLSRISKMSVSEIDKSKELLFSRIKFIPESDIAIKHWSKATQIVRDVDMDDIAFVALSISLENTPLWTGDKKLINHLSEIGFNNCLTTNRVIEIRKELDKKAG